MNHRYRPFEKELFELSGDDLAGLRHVHEGWYVEYKSESIKPRDIAKSLASFANQLGGWLFVGVSEDRELHVAENFPGIPNAEVASFLEALRNASKDIISPDVFYSSRVFSGPVESLGLEADRSIVVVQIPQGADCPYVHNDGRIYRRIADSSDPKPETDRSRLDLLIERSKTARSRLSDRITRIPTVSKGEQDQCYIHFSIMSDPYETMGHWYPEGISKFSALMGEANLPFDNIYSKSGGYVARQAKNNDPYSRILTWEFSRHCHSFITFPVQSAASGFSYAHQPEASIYESFTSKVREHGLDSSRVLDLNLVLILLMSLIRRHRRLVWQAKVKGPFYVKAHLENIWRTVPFVDLPAYQEHIEEYGLPVVQDTDVLVPSGTSLDTFAVLPERSVPQSDSLTMDQVGDAIGDAIEIGIHIFECLGIPRQFLIHSRELFTRHFNFIAAKAIDT